MNKHIKIMDLIRKMFFFLIAFAVSIILTACNTFDIHPYDVNVKGETYINAKNKVAIQNQTLDKDTLRFACISDSHQWYSDTQDAISDINRRRDSLDFVIHCGDLTDTGTNKEFEWAERVLSKLTLPYVAMIGNHDYLGTGEEYYAKKYGAKNFYMIAGRVKFVFLDTNATEYDYVALVPDLNYIREQGSVDKELFDRTIVCMHARPYSDQFNDNIAEPFEYYLKTFLNPMFCINGHDHCLQMDDLFNDGLMYYGVPSTSDRQYMIFTITEEGYSYEVVNY